MISLFKKKEPRKCATCDWKLNPNHYAEWQNQCIFCKNHEEALLREAFEQVKAKQAIDDAVEAAWERNR